MHSKTTANSNERLCGKAYIHAIDVLYQIRGNFAKVGFDRRHYAVDFNDMNK